MIAKVFGAFELYKYFHSSDSDSEASLHSFSVLWMAGHLHFTDEPWIVDIMAKCLLSFLALLLLLPFKILMKYFFLLFT
jgi:hypothetical protein